jgi:hypothetical protein
MKLIIRDWTETPATVLGTVTWSPEDGVQFDNPHLAEHYATEGAALPGGRQVYPVDGREFMEALRVTLGQGFIRAEEAE